MSTQEMKKHGFFSWNELMTTDVEAAKTFYGELFGWQAQDIEAGGMQYTMIKTGDREIGGIMGMPEEANAMPPMWGSYVTVDNVDERTNRAQRLGAQVRVEPRDIPNVGRFAVITDPQGAMITLITYA